MALEREILARIQDAVDTGDSEQEQLYKSLLGDLTWRKSQGLRDQDQVISNTTQEPLTKVASAPNYRLVRSSDLAKRMNATVGRELGDDILLEDLMPPRKSLIEADTNAPIEWTSFCSPLRRSEKQVLTKALGEVLFRAKDIRTLGDLRGLSARELSMKTRLGERSIFLLTEGFKRPAETT